MRRSVSMRGSGDRCRRRSIPRPIVPRARWAGWARGVRHTFPEAFEPGGPALPETPAFAHLFAGLAQLADWLGSDTRFFPFSEFGEDRALTAFVQAQNAVQTIGLDVAERRAQLQGDAPSFATAFGVSAPRPIQRAMDEPLGPLLILESETGSGKTEAALWRFARLFQAGEVDSLYFALPTRVAATQIYGRVRDFVRRLWPINAPVVVRALPGYESATERTLGLLKLKQFE
jgi:CRISPR-associated endonuclease/helicase Cas3